MAINSAKVRRFNLEKEDLSSNLKVKPQNNVSGNQTNAKAKPQNNVSGNQTNAKVKPQNNASKNRTKSKVKPNINVNSNQSNAAPPKDCVESLRISCSWGNAKKKKLWGYLEGDEVFVDLDLNCVMLDDKDQLLDYILSPSYGNISLFSNPYNINQVFKGKLLSLDGAISHSGDAYGGKGAQESITVDLTKVDPKISKIFFFLNVYNNPYGKNKEVYDFSEISSVKVDITKNALSSLCAQKSTKSKILKPVNCKNKYAIVLGYLQKIGNTWKYITKDKLYDDLSYIITIQRICNSCIA